MHHGQDNPPADFIDGEHGHAHLEGSITGPKGEFWHACLKNGTEWYAFEERDVRMLLDDNKVNGFVYTLDQWHAIPYGSQLRS